MNVIEKNIIAQRLQVLHVMLYVHLTSYVCLFNYSV